MALPVSSEINYTGSEIMRKGSEKPQNTIQSILNAIHPNIKTSIVEIEMKLGVSSRAVEKRIKAKPNNVIIRRNGPDRGGYWKIIDK